jgi:hypothetical protein
MLTVPVVDWPEQVTTVTIRRIVSRSILIVLELERGIDVSFEEEGEKRAVRPSDNKLAAGTT